MRDFVGADDLSFTPEEQEAIRRAARPQAQDLSQPVPFPRRRWLIGGAAIGALVWWMAPHRDGANREPAGAGLGPFAVVAVTRTGVHLRENPSVVARSLSVIPAGSVLAIEEQRMDGFDRVLCGRQRGYAAAAYLALTNGVAFTPHTGTRIGPITGSARLREQASSNAAVTTALPAFTPVTVMGFTPAGWCLVWTGSRAGFVWGGLLEDHPSLPFHPRQDGTERVVLYQGAVLRP